MRLDTCRLAFDADLMLTGQITYDTTSHVFTIDGVAKAVAYTTVAIDGDEVDVISARSIRIAASRTVRAIGRRALAIVVSDSLTIEADAQIDVSAGGAGAPTSCVNHAGFPDDSQGGAGGGGGAGFGAAGGDGGAGDLDGSTPHPHGAFGAAPVEAVPAGLRGGCPGGAGGNGSAPGGAGGPGGGALYLVAGNFIELDSLAPINAGGGGGHGGQHNSAGGNAGGGGGGSGGVAVLEAPHIMGTAAAIVANGGGGGEGSDLNVAGADGSPGSLTTSRAKGGEGQAPAGGDGGRGGSLEVPEGESVISLLNGGGGGGGGGVGIIQVVSADVHVGPISPAPR